MMIKIDEKKPIHITVSATGLTNLEPQISSMGIKKAVIINNTGHGGWMITGKASFSWSALTSGHNCFYDIHVTQMVKFPWCTLWSQVYWWFKGVICKVQSEMEWRIQSTSGRNSSCTDMTCLTIHKHLPMHPLYLGFYLNCKNLQTLPLPVNVTASLR